LLGLEMAVPDLGCLDGGAWASAAAAPQITDTAAGLSSRQVFAAANLASLVFELAEVLRFDKEVDFRRNKNCSVPGDSAFRRRGDT